MAYGDITGGVNSYRTPGKPGVQTVRRAVLLKDGSAIGSAAVNYLSDTKSLEQLTNVDNTTAANTTALKATLYNSAGLYIGTAGNIMVNFAGEKSLIDSGTTTSAETNKLVDSGKNFLEHIQLRDFIINTTDGTVAFVASIAATKLTLVDIANSSANIFALGEKYEIYRPIIFQNVAAGSFLPIEVDRVFDTGTTADDIMAIY
jgi:hypothetical protein|tara:strand:+ start:1688 stop:2296 length:609 start_codon:yes stop_codon:yes gene_type:complete